MSSFPPVALTGLWVAAYRAQESERPDYNRLCFDPLAAELAGPKGFELVAECAKVNPASTKVPFLPIRTKFIDDGIVEYLRQNPDCKQIVILAAGMDTRAFRLPLPRDLTVYELDHKEVFDYKNTKICSLRYEPVCRRVCLPADLAVDPWTDQLAQAGFSKHQKTIFLVEGLYMYLPHDAVENVTGLLATIAAPHSLLLADMQSEAVFKSPQLKPMLDFVTSINARWKSGYDDPGKMFAALGWDATVYQSSEVGFKYGRWPIAPYPLRTTAPQGYDEKKWGPWASVNPRSWLIAASRSPSQAAAVQTRSGLPEPTRSKL
eukprot:GILK01008988.1.p1 GENE.GILK01008988.1~~GILK01008988.1.p1  ORF type:complete len:337 (-),score=17.76 GILK01008988.1:169-1125(-)